MNKIGIVILESTWQYLAKLSTCILYSPAVPLLGSDMSEKLLHRSTKKHKKHLSPRLEANLVVFLGKRISRMK